MPDLFKLNLCQLFARRPTLQSLGITQAQVDQQYPQVLEHYAEQLVVFFAGPRRRSDNRWDQIAQMLAQRLHSARVVLDDASSRAMVGLVLSYPDSGERDKRFGDRSPQVFLVARHDCLALAISREGDTPLAFTLSRGIEVIAAPALAGAERLEHDVFDGWALASLDQALLRVARVDPSQFPDLEALDRQLTWASHLVGFFEASWQRDSLRHELAQQLPDWLRNASPTGRLAYSKWLEAMALFHERSEGAQCCATERAVAMAAQTVFAGQLALHLRRLTLECFLQGLCNVTYEGYRVMRAAVKTSEARRRLRGVAIVFRPLVTGDGYVVGPLAGTQGPWVMVRPGTGRVIEQVNTAPDAGHALVDPFMVLYRAGVARWLSLLECPLDTLARLKQMGGNLEGDYDAVRAWLGEASLLRNLALLLVCPVSEQPVAPLDVHPRVKRLDSQWAGARKDLSVVQEQQLQALKRPAPNTRGQLIMEGIAKGLHLFNDVLIYNKDENHYNVLSNNRICLNCTLVEHQLVDNPEQPTEYGPHIDTDANGHWQLQRTPRLRRDLERLNSAVRAGNALSATLPALLDNASRQALVPGALPVEVEEALEREASRFDAAARAVQDAGGNAPQVSELHEQSRQLRARGRALRIEMTRHTAKPTVGDVEYLLAQHVIAIRRVDGRVKETIDGLEDYLQEYEIQDLTDNHQPLWYAHFHYATLQAADGQPTSAHLKTAAQRRLGRTFERDERAAGRNTTVYRGPITNAAGRQLFLGVTSPT